MKRGSVVLITLVFVCSTQSELERDGNTKNTLPIQIDFISLHEPLRSDITEKPQCYYLLCVLILCDQNCKKESQTKQHQNLNIVLSSLIIYNYSDAL